MQPVVVDAHVHLFPPEWIANKATLLDADAYFGLLYRGPRGYMADAEMLLESMDQAGIALSIASGFGWSDQGRCHEHNAYLLEVTRRYPARILGLAKLNPRAGPSAVSQAADAASAGLAGFGELMPDGPGYRLTDDALMDPLLEAAVALGVPVLTHVSEPIGHQYAGKGTVTPGDVVHLAARHRDARIVCGHFGGGLPFYELMPEVRRQVHHVYYDSAAWPLLYGPNVFASVEAAAPGKVLFASDYPLISQADTLRRTRESGLAGEQLDAVLTRNWRGVFTRVA